MAALAALMCSLGGCVPPVAEVSFAAPPVLEANNWTRAYHWSRRQSRRLNVYVTPGTTVAERVRCDSLVDRALEAWNSDGSVHLARTWSPAAADIRIVWTQTLPVAHPGVTVLRPNRRGELIGADVFVSAVVPARENISSDQVLYGVIAHEVGHALGLPHAHEREQIMNEVLHALDITSADLAALRALRNSGT